MYAFLAYIAGVSGIILGFAEPGRLHDSVLRKVLLYGMVPIAAYAVIQRAVPLASWDRDWIQATGLTSIGTSSNGKVRVFASLNSPGALAALLGLSLLCYLTVRRHRGLAVLGAVLLTIALALTFVRSAWIALILGAVAHVIASGGRSARLVFGALAIVAAAAVALGPVSPVAHEVVNRFSTIGSFSTDTSATARTATLSETLPAALGAPLGHGLGSAGEPSKLSGNSTLRAPDNGYLALLYQVGPFGFVLVAAAVCVILRAAWIGARARAPGQQLRLLLFAMLIFLLVSLASGDQLYGSLGVVFWMIGGQALAFEQRHRVRNAAIASPYASSRRSTTLVHV
jgi:O-antigen ligase